MRVPPPVWGSAHESYPDRLLQAHVKKLGKAKKTMMFIHEGEPPSLQFIGYERVGG